VVLYSINVFITFTLSQLGMVRHWWAERRTAQHWRKKLAVNSLGFALTAFILVMLTATKFSEGGWITLVVTSLFVAMAFLTQRHYRNTSRELERLDDLMPAIAADLPVSIETAKACLPICDSNARTAVVFVNGFNGLGVHTVLAVTRMFPSVFKNFVFAQIGLLDAGNFKGAGELENLRSHISIDVAHYADYMRSQNVWAETVTEIGHDVVETANTVAAELVKRFPHAVFFGGQLVFARESRLTRFLHNFTVFTLQRKFFRQGMPFIVVPIRV
ncbi:MAG TPA: hypothetical protein VMZ27_16320, partial [Candidatus Saccharimonadales bacterium]|nr:hypothetical protein [Candidatus Saccharimonadales bacterium]